MENIKKLKGVIFVFVLLSSFIICSSASAADVNSMNHYNSNLSKVNELKTIHASSSSILKNSSTKSSNIPSYYDLRRLGKLTPVKNQGFAGTCWAFAAIGSLESSLLPYEKWNFSENNMKNLCSYTYAWSFDRGYADAGCWEQATAYLTSYNGPVTSDMDPYNEFSGLSPSGLNPVKHVQETVIIGSRNSTGTINNFQLKNAIRKYGAIYTLMQFSEYFLNPMTNGYYYCGSSNDVNHAVNIVGWDDNYSKDNFVNVAPANGAFIIRNSWGSEWGDNGYFYVSYYDKLLGMSEDNVVFMNAETTSNYDNIYQYDPLGYVGRYGFNRDTAWFSNVFTARSNEMLKAASFYVLKPNAHYNLYVYLDPNSKNPASGTLVATKEGVLSTAGYKTVPLNRLVALLNGHKFSIVVKLTIPNLKDPITIEYPMEFYSSKARAHHGESFVSIKGISWVDMTNLVPNANVCLKAFTVSTGADLSITKKINNPHPRVNSKVSFTLNVKNNGPETALNVIVKDNLPLGLTFLSYITNYGIYDSNNGIWTIGTLPRGAVVTLIIKCIIYNLDEFTNKVNVTSSTYDPILYNNIAMVKGNVVNQMNNITKEPKSIPMQNTGIPAIPLGIALIIITGGLVAIIKNK